MCSVERTVFKRSLESKVSVDVVFLPYFQCPSPDHLPVICLRTLEKILRAPMGVSARNGATFVSTSVTGSGGSNLQTGGARSNAAQKLCPSPEKKIDFECQNVEF